METEIFYLDDTDVRVKYLAEMLRLDGKTVFSYSCGDSFGGANVVFAPNKKLSAPEAARLADATVYAGNLPDYIQAELASCKATYKNFMADERFAVQNARLTAEALLTVISQTGTKSLYDERFLILGLGRIGKALAIIFDKLSLEFAVHTFTRAELEYSSLYAEKCYFGGELRAALQCSTVIINTIPKSFIAESDLKWLKRGARIIDAASVPCIDFPRERCSCYIPALGLPSKFMPESAARIMYQFITGDKNGDKHS